MNQLSLSQNRILFNVVDKKSVNLLRRVIQFQKPQSGGSYELSGLLRHS